MAGLLNGALAGLGKGMSESGQFLMRITADEQKEARLQQYEMAREQRQNQRQDVIRAEDRSWQQEDYQTQRGDAVEDRDFNADMTRWQVNTTQAGANARSAAQIGSADRRAGMGLLQQGRDAEGNPVWFNPMSGDQYNAPPGVTLADDGKLTDTEKAQLEQWGDQRKAIIEQNMGEPDPETNPAAARQLLELDSKMNRILNPGGGGGLLNGVLNDLEQNGQLPQSGSDSPSSPQQSQSAPPPRPGVSSVDELETRVRGQRADEQAVQSSQRQNQQIEQTINQIRGISNRMGIGPGMSSADRQRMASEARQMADQLIKENNLDDRQIQRLEGAVQNIVQYGG